MSRAKLYYIWTVDEDGKVKITNRKGFDQDMLMLKGKRLQVEIKPYHATRSNKQNAYYHACVIPYVMDGLNAIGIAKHQLSRETVHEMLKAKFLREDIASDHWNGEFITVIGSTTDLNKLEFSDYIEQIRQWAAEYLNIQIPLPGEQADLDF